MVWTILNDNEDKTTLPNYLKDLYSREPHQVHSLLSTLINPKDANNELDVEKCLWVICGGQKPDEFTRIIKANDRSVICGLVWDANFIAYRCKTCGITPCMSLCAECFENGNHEGHDFNMFKSGAGGACDCGDVEVMKSCGFCSRHGPKSAKSSREIPEDVTLMVNLVVPKLIYFLLSKLEDATLEKHGKVQKADEEVAKLLLKLCEMGDVTRKIVAKSMLQLVQKKWVPSPETASKFIVKSDTDMPPYNVMRRQSSTDSARHPISESGIQGLSDSERIQNVADSIHSLPGTSKDCDIPYVLVSEENETVLEKLIDLLIELKFPQFLVTLVLSMLQETDYKKEFMRAFCSRYSKIANLLTHRFELDEDQKLCNRLVHASVQLFSNENLTYNMVKNHNLLSIIVTALSDLISRTLVKVDDNDDNINKSLFVVNCNHEIIHHHRYWPVVSDFHNLLSHSKISRYFLGEAALIRRWMGILTHFTGMNKNIRQLIVHIAYESMTYQYAYSTEIETSSHIMTNLLSVCTSPNEKDYIRLVLSECVRALRSWFRMIQVQIVKPFLSDLNGETMTSTGPVPRHEITFHLPLHRYLAGFISQAVNHCGMSLEEVLPSEEVLWCVMEHVLRIQVGIGEILAGLWVRNGSQLRCQEEFYLQGQYCNQCVDLDIFLLQVCIMALDSDQFLTMLIQRYKLESWFMFGKLASSTQPADNDVQQALLENMLNLILQLIYQRMYMGLSEERVVHLEVVTKLTMGDFTHSQLTENLPEKPGLTELTELFDEVLSKVSDYKQPTNESGQLTQGIYALKPDLWENEFQPLHVMLRGSYKRGYQLALDKYKGWYQSQNKTKVQGLWPPFRTPLQLNEQYQSLYRILHSRVLHSMLFTVLYKTVREPESVNDNITYLTFYLIDMCIDAPATVPTPNIEKGCLKPDITAAELEDGTVPQAIVKCVLFLQENRHLPTLYKGKAVDQRVHELCRKLISSPNTFTIRPDQYTLQDVTEALILMCKTRLQPPLFAQLFNAAEQLWKLSVTTGIGPLSFDKKTHMYHIQQVLEQLPPHRYKLINLLLYYLSILIKEELATLDQICSVYVTFGYDPTVFSSMISCYDWMFRVRKRPVDSIEGMFDIKYKSDSIIKNAYECVLGTSMLQCMYEIKKRLQSQDLSQSPSSSSTYTSHNGVEAISVILGKLSKQDQNNAKLLRSLERADASTPDRGTSPCSTSEAKRKRAKERQAKLLAAFATKQRVFEAQMEAEDYDIQEDEDEPRTSSAPGYTCIICGSTGTSTETNPLAVFVMCQPASLLLHSIKPDMERTIMNDMFEDIPTFYSTVNSHYTTLKNLYSSSSAWQSAGLRVQPGLHVQSCSHYLHIGCYKTYSKSQQSRNTDPLHSHLSGKELSCPICRRVSNTVLPFAPDPIIKPYSPVVEVKVPISPATQIPLPYVHTCVDPLYKTSHPPHCMGCSSLSLATAIKQVEHQAPIDLINSTIIKSTSTEYYDAVDSFILSLEEYYKKYVEQKSLSRLDVIMLALHCTLQCELIERNNNLSTHLECSRKYCTGRLVSVLATTSNSILEALTSSDTLVALISVLYSGTEEGALNPGDVPVVLQDPSWVLLKFVLFSRLQAEWKNYVAVVRMLFTLQTVRALISVVAKFSCDEQRAWIHKAMSAGDDFEAVLGMLCQELSSIGVMCNVGEMDITSYVWSIQSVEANVQTLCLPLLRDAVLLGHHMYGKPLPAGPTTGCEYTQLAVWFGFVPAATQPTSFIKALNLPREKLLSICSKLCRQLPRPDKQKASPLVCPLLPVVETWARPQLLTLPKLYGKLYLHYRHIQCKVCWKVPNDPALCLVCGQLVCVRSQCCQWLNTGECTKHAQKCGAGTAIYLVIMSSTVVIIRGDRVYLWGSVYLDQHDEEDIDLKRGKPLYLSDTRYECLNQQWRSHSFDHTLKRWGWHQQQF